MRTVIAVLSALALAQAANLRGLQTFIPVPPEVQAHCALPGNADSDGCQSWMAMALMVQNDCDTECQSLVFDFANLQFTNRRARRMANSLQFVAWVNAGLNLPFSAGPTIDAISVYRPYGALVGVVDSTNPKKYCLNSFADYLYELNSYLMRLPSGAMRRLNEAPTLEAARENMAAAAEDFPEIDETVEEEMVETENGKRELRVQFKSHIIRSLRDFCPGCLDHANALVTPYYPSWIPMAQNFYCSKTSSPMGNPRDWCLVGLRAALLDQQGDGAAKVALCRPSCGDNILTFLVMTGRLTQQQADMMLAMLPTMCAV